MPVLAVCLITIRPPRHHHLIGPGRRRHHQHQQFVEAAVLSGSEWGAAVWQARSSPGDHVIIRPTASLAFVIPALAVATHDHFNTTPTLTRLPLV